MFLFCRAWLQFFNYNESYAINPPNFTKIYNEKWLFLNKIFSILFLKINEAQKYFLSVFKFTVSIAITKVDNQTNRKPNPEIEPIVVAHSG